MGLRVLLVMTDQALIEKVGAALTKILKTSPDAGVFFPTVKNFGQRFLHQEIVGGEYSLVLADENAINNVQRNYIKTQLFAWKILNATDKNDIETSLIFLLKDSALKYYLRDHLHASPSIASVTVVAPPSSNSSSPLQSPTRVVLASELKEAEPSLTITLTAPGAQESKVLAATPRYKEEKRRLSSPTNHQPPIGPFFANAGKQPVKIGKRWRRPSATVVPVNGDEPTEPLASPRKQF